MKAFIASLVLLAVLMVCSVLNCFYIDRVTGKMLAGGRHLRTGR